MVINSWAKCRIVGTWADAEGYKLVGVTRAFLTRRLVVDPDNVMVPAGNYAPGSVELVHEDDSKPSLDFMAPATDDPNVRATPEGAEWALVLTVAFEGEKRESETFYIDALRRRSYRPENLRKPQRISEFDGCREAAERHEPSH